METENITDPDYKLENSLGYLTRKISQGLGGRLQHHFRAAEVDVTSEQWIILVILWNQDCQTQQCLADKCGKDKAGITKLVDGLEKRGLVIRVSGKEDRRQNIINLTEKGQELRGKLIHLGQVTLSEASTAVSEEHFEICKNVLSTILAKLNELKQNE